MCCRGCAPRFGDGCGPCSRGAPLPGERQTGWFWGGDDRPLPRTVGEQPQVIGCQPGEGWAHGPCPSGSWCYRGDIPAGDGVFPRCPPPPQAVLSPSGPIPGCGEGAVPRSPTATRDREEAPGGGPGAQPELGTACPLTDPTLPGRPLQPGTGVLSRFTRSRLHALKRIPGWGRTSPVPTPRGRGGVVVTGPSSPPRRSKPGPSRTPGAAAPLISPPPGVSSPKHPLCCFAKALKYSWRCVERLLMNF